MPWSLRIKTYTFIAIRPSEKHSLPWTGGFCMPPAATISRKARRFLPSHFLLAPFKFSFSASNFFLSAQKVFITNFVTHITNFVIRVTKFLTHITKFVIKILRQQIKIIKDVGKTISEKIKTIRQKTQNFFRPGVAAPLLAECLDRTQCALHKKRFLAFHFPFFSLLFTRLALTLHKLGGGSEEQRKNGKLKASAFHFPFFSLLFTRLALTLP